MDAIEEQLQVLRVNARRIIGLDLFENLLWTGLLSFMLSMAELPPSGHST